MPDEPIKPAEKPSTPAPRPGVAAKPTQLKPSQTVVKEPPKEVLEQTFTLDKPEMLATHDPQRLTDENGKPLKRVEEQTVDPEDVAEAERARKVLFGKKEDEAKPEEKKEEKAPVQEEKKLSTFIKPPAQKGDTKEKDKKDDKSGDAKLITPPAAKARDLSGYTPEQQTVLRQMSGPAFDYTKELIEENKTLKETHIFQHPNAYVLDPQFQQIQNEIGIAQRAADYWEKQLLLIDEGKPFQSIIGLNEDGSFKLGEAIAPNKKMEEAVRRNMNNCLAEATGRRNNLQQFPQQYQNRVKQDLNAIHEERAKRFAWVTQPELLDHTIDMGPELGDVSIRDIRQNIVNLFPPYMRNHPACEVVADMYVGLRIQDLEIKQATSAAGIAEQKVEEVKRAEPTSQTKPAPPSENDKAIGGVKTFSLEGLPK